VKWEWIGWALVWGAFYAGILALMHTLLGWSLQWGAISIGLGYAFGYYNGRQTEAKWWIR
jgi:hypothetical protein